jgi:hypothetical protein
MTMAVAARGAFRRAAAPHAGAAWDIIPPLPEIMPIVGSRIGLDLNPVDVRDEDAALWLRALVWPEHTERAQRLAQATAVAQQHPPELISGDALHDLPDVLARVPDDQALCVFHSFVINQFSHAGREQLSALLVAQSARRTIYRLSMEWIHTPETQPGTACIERSQWNTHCWLTSMSWPLVAVVDARYRVAGAASGGIGRGAGCRARGYGPRQLGVLHQSQQRGAYCAGGRGSRSISCFTMTIM